MITTRIIPCLDCRSGRVVKGVKFSNLRDSGDPVELATRYEAEGADELVLLDISATIEARYAQLHTIEQVRRALSIPLTVGGGVQDEADIARLLEAGADKVSINTAAVSNPELIARAAKRFGAQCTVVAIDAERHASNTWQIRVRSGSQKTPLEAVSWAQACNVRGAGEILLTSFDRDGTGNGYDLELLSRLSSAVSIPVIASGGARDATDLLAAVRAGASAVLAASMFHEKRVSIYDAKKFLSENGVTVRI